MSDNSMYDNLRKHEQRKKAKGSLTSLLFFYIIPFILINAAIFYFATALPDFEVTASDPIDYKTVEITISRKSFLPVRQITANIDNTPVPLEQISDTVYHAHVNTNGNFQVDAVGINTMVQSFYMYVDSIDVTPPVIEGEIINDDTVNVSFEDEGCGIDFDSIKATNFLGEEVKPKSVDRERHTASFDIKTNLLTVSISDMAGNSVKAEFHNR